jgi:uncharacterized RDD family membrane protein YckC
MKALTTNGEVAKAAWWSGFFAGLAVGLIISITVIAILYEWT